MGVVLGVRSSSAEHHQPAACPSLRGSLPPCMTPQEAISAPRWLYGRSWGAASNDIKIEGRVPAAVTEELARRGHPVNIVDDYIDIMGHAGAILLHENGVMQGGNDPRSDGQAAGW